MTSTELKEETQDLTRRSAYIDGVRGMFKLPRIAGFVLIALGAAGLIWCRVNGALYTPPMIGAGLLLAAGWLLLIYATVRRYQWMRAHPFDSNTDT